MENAKKSKLYFDDDRIIAIAHSYVSSIVIYD